VSRYIAVDELPAVAKRNGLKVESDRYTGALLLSRKSGRGGQCGVIYGPQGLVDWSATAAQVLRSLFGRGGVHA